MQYWLTRCEDTAVADRWGYSSLILQADIDAENKKVVTGQAK